MIELHGLSVHLGGRAVLDDVSTVIRPGELVYLLGRNGTGKTTLLRTVSGMIRPAAGGVRVNGRPLAGSAAPMRQLGVHLDTEGALPGHTARRHLRWLAASAGITAERVDAVLDQVTLTGVASRRVADYSLGMRQRLGIAGALLGDAPTLILDEPVNGLDIDGIRWLRGLLRDLADDGRSLLIASHHLDEVARTADRIIVLDDGRIVADAAVQDFVGAHDDLEAAYLAVTS